MDFAYLIGAALFPAAIAQWALLRSRRKAGSYPLSKAKTFLLSLAMWGTGIISLLSMATVMVISGFDAQSIQQSEAWIVLASGLFAYAAGRPLVAFWDKRGAYMAPSK